MKFSFRRVFFAVLAASLTSVIHADTLIDRAQKILAQEPEEVFAESVENGTVEFVHVPFCVKGMPGFDFENHSGERPIPEKLWSTCEELMGRERYETLLELEYWARRYNRLVSEHVSEQGPK